MIGKSIKSGTNSTKATKIRNLTNYILDCTGEMATPGEKVLFSGSQGFAFDGVANQISEMIALAQSNVKCKDPIMHVILSLQGDETMSEKQAREQVKIVLKELKLEGHQAVWGVHQDTDNVHLHIAINRIHPVTEKAMKANGGWEIEGIHKAVARIEKEQGFRPEKNGRYSVDADGELVKAEASRDKKPNAKATAQEIRTGEKSAIRIAIEDGGPILKSATSWQDLHTKLSAVGMSYERKGSGALIFVGETPVKASDAHRDAGLSKMMAKLGPYEEKGTKNEYFSHEIADADVAEFGAGNGLRKLSQCSLASRSRAKAGVGDAEGLLQTDARPGGHFSQLMRRSAAANRDGSGRDGYPAGAAAGDGGAGQPVGGRSGTGDDLARRSADRKPSARSAGNDGGGSGARANGAGGIAGAGRPARSPEPLKKGGGARKWDIFAQARREHFSAKKADSAILNASVSAQRLALKDDQKAARTAIFSGDWTGRRDELNALRSIVAARQAVDKLKLQDRINESRVALRLKHQPFPDFETWLREKHGDDLAQAWRHGRDLVATEQANGFAGGQFIHPVPTDIRAYTPEIAGRFVRYYDAAGLHAFTDVGRRIELHSSLDSGILAGLQLAGQKWGGVNLLGNDEFKLRAVRLAQANGIKILNPELQDEITRLKAVAALAKAAAAKVAMAKPAGQPGQHVGMSIDAGDGHRSEAELNEDRLKEAATAKPTPVPKGKVGLQVDIDRAAADMAALTRKAEALKVQHKALSAAGVKILDARKREPAMRAAFNEAQKQVATIRRAIGGIEKMGAIDRRMAAMEKVQTLGLGKMLRAAVTPDAVMQTQLQAAMAKLATMETRMNANLVVAKQATPEAQMAQIVAEHNAVREQWQAAEHAQAQAREALASFERAKTEAAAEAQRAAARERLNAAGPVAKHGHSGPIEYERPKG